jgi:hypothetical protein
MAAVRIVLRLISISIAGFFAAKGGAWWILAVMYILTAIVPIKPKGTRFAFLSCVVITAGFAIAFAVYALRVQPSPLLGLLTAYGAAQIVQEWLAGRTVAAPPSRPTSPPR